MTSKLITYHTALVERLLSEDTVSLSADDKMVADVLTELFTSRDLDPTNMADRADILTDIQFHFQLYEACRHLKV